MMTCNQFSQRVSTFFTGREFDPETQIYLYRARYYAALIGRFVGRYLRDSIPMGEYESEQ